MFYCLSSEKKNGNHKDLQWQLLLWQIEDHKFLNSYLDYEEAVKRCAIKPKIQFCVTVWKLKLQYRSYNLMWIYCVWSTIGLCANQQQY